MKNELSITHYGNFISSEAKKLPAHGSIVLSFTPALPAPFSPFMAKMKKVFFYRTFILSFICFNSRLQRRLIKEENLSFSIPCGRCHQHPFAPISSWEIYEIHCYYLHKLSALTDSAKNLQKRENASIYLFS